MITVTDIHYRKLSATNLSGAMPQEVYDKRKSEDVVIAFALGDTILACRILNEIYMINHCRKIMDTVFEYIGKPTGIKKLEALGIELKSLLRLD